jgi:pyruvate dehydrogenase E2 component (dihydrolipoamide acetyltransferase)
VQGTGPNGRVTRVDVETWQPGLLGRSHGGPRRADEKVRITQMRKSIAKRLTAVHTTAPTFFLTAVLECDNLVQLRTQLVAAGMKVSYNDILIKACAKALAESPQVNASWGDDGITRYGSVHVGVAVALDDGLITPVLRDCHAKPLAQIAVESRDLAERARNRKLRAPELSGATFSISNLGMFDVAEFSAIINPPEGAILAVGSVRRVPVVDDAGLGVGRRMMLTISCDHRVMDGAMGARFLQDVKRLLEEPLRLLV